MDIPAQQKWNFNSTAGQGHGSARGGARVLSIDNNAQKEYRPRQNSCSGLVQ